MSKTTVAESLVDAFASRGVQRIFGVPGGGSSLDIIDAAAKRGVDFVLTRTESAAVMMAAATSELSNTLGVALTTKGPGSASSANGVAYAALERLPVALLTDGFTPTEQTYITHQVFDQKALLNPLTKGHSRLEGNSVVQDIESNLEAAMTPPRGPVYFELTSETARSTPSLLTDWKGDKNRNHHHLALDENAITKGKNLLSKADKPILIVGMEARESSAARAVRTLVTTLGCPALTTYKAKGVIADQDPFYAGIFTGGSKEKDCIDKADLIILCGIDPVEFIRQPWRYSAPVIDISEVKHPVHYLKPDAGLYGSISKHIARLISVRQSTSWLEEDVAMLRLDMHALLMCKRVKGINPQQVVETAFELAQSLPTIPRMTVDAGAHMFSAMEFWPCADPCDVLISNGLATMAFALPAAIASALHEPHRQVIAFTGDGGLLMCLGELLTAVQCQTNIIIVVFNDASLSLIDIKQQEKQFPSRGTRWPRPDFSKIMKGMGGNGFKVENLESYKHSLVEALHGNGPTLIDVSVDASGYSDQLRAMRG